MARVIARTFFRLVISGVLLCALAALAQVIGSFGNGGAAWALVWFVAFMLIAWPALPLFDRLSRSDDTTNHPSEQDRIAQNIACESASTDAMEQYRAKSHVTQTCPVCRSVISVTPVERIDDATVLLASTDCSCRRCAHKFRVDIHQHR